MDREERAAEQMSKDDLFCRLYIQSTNPCAQEMLPSRLACPALLPLGISGPLALFPILSEPAPAIFPPPAPMVGPFSSAWLLPFYLRTKWSLLNVNNKKKKKKNHS